MRARGSRGALGALDDGADRLFDRFRGVPVADGAAAMLSNLADFGLAWVVLAAVKARRPGPARSRAVQALAVSGAVSATVNTAVKKIVRRGRPGADPSSGRPALNAVLPVRRPTSSSFPSGHTLAAFCTAVVLPDDPAEQWACLAFAGAVAASRVHRRAHHASDVVGGMVIGTVAGALVRGTLARRALVRATLAGRRSPPALD